MGLRQGTAATTASPGIVPGLFIETTASITIVTTVIIAATIVAVVLTMRREQAPVRVFD